jgi:uncharacterized protein (TIGR00730 family)
LTFAEGQWHTTFMSEAQPPIQKVCVYCGSGAGENPTFARAARDLGKRLAQAEIGLVYGGGDLGLMGLVARAVLKHNGHVTGIIPAFLSAREHMFTEVQELIVVDDMHQRKHLMFERSVAFVALPGGIGTLEEFVEQLTWTQLGRHEKPIVLANIDCFYDPLLDLFATMTRQGFIRSGFELKMTVAESVDAILPAIARTLAATHTKPAAEAEAEAEIAAKF